MRSMTCARWMFVLAMELIAITGCAKELPRQGNVGADSIVLERTRCYGTCPAYRVRVAKGGGILFESRNPGDSTHAIDSIAPSGFLALVALGANANLPSFPDSIASNKDWCASEATDHPTTIITYYWPYATKRVVDYYGCYTTVEHTVAPRVQELRQLEALVDSVAGTPRWIRRPARR